ncbi:hypothetical protein ILYODFUR_009749 [Ilyodon furcidens]|uniref:Uncharacterized protein n=1 Tax=Ilyodon furcidens TaxID=33524 RepID=A0ABV0UER6_9TELE
MEVNKETGGMEKEDEYTEGGMDRVWRMGEEWMEGWKEECDRWVVPGQRWEGPERLASQEFLKGLYDDPPERSC